MKFLHITKTLMRDPWMITPEVHMQLCQIVQDHYDGSAHAEGGCALLFGTPEESENAIQVELRSQGIAFIEVHGVIGKRVSSIRKSSGVVDVDDVEAALLEADADPMIRGILMDFDSPGGTVVGVPELADLVRAMDKPVVAFTDVDMNSAAIWIAHGADIVVSTGSAQVGCIGVFIAMLDSSERFEQLGLKMELFKTGAFKGMGLSGTSLTEAQKEFLQNRVVAIGDRFTGFLLEGRNIPASAFEGQVFEGIDAEQNNVVDVIGDMDDAIAELKELIESGT